MPLIRLYKYFMNSRDDFDERIGMSEKQKKLVQNTWATVRKNEISSGIAVMIAFFTRYPEYQNDFKVFKDIPLDQLSKNKGFQAHSANVMRAFSSIFDYIHDPELIEASILSLAERHKIRGQKREQFENLRLVLEDLLPSVFGKQYTPEVQEAWKKMFDYMFPIFCRVYDD